MVRWWARVTALSERCVLWSDGGQVFCQRVLVRGVCSGQMVGEGNCLK